MARYRADLNLPYFCTVSVLDWVPVFVDGRYVDPVIESLQFCRVHKGMQLFAYTVMPNHLHLIAAAGDLHVVMRDFKRFTSRRVHDLLKEDGRVSILEWLERATQRARSGRGELGLWQDGFHPQALESRAVFDQKLEYVHANPVRKGLVRGAQDWWYSSAGNYAGLRGICLEVDVLEW